MTALPSMFALTKERPCRKVCCLHVHSPYQSLVHVPCQSRMLLLPKMSATRWQARKPRQTHLERQCLLLLEVYGSKCSSPHACPQHSAILHCQRHWVFLQCPSVWKHTSCSACNTCLCSEICFGQVSTEICAKNTYISFYYRFEVTVVCKMLVSFTLLSQRAFQTMLTFQDKAIVLGMITLFQVPQWKHTNCWKQ